MLHVNSGFHYSVNMSVSSSSTGKVAAISGAAFSPLYKQIKALLVQSLHAGEWKPGESIPSELDLASRFQVSQGTVRKAIDELAAENLLIRRQGKGTFVATHHEAQVRYRFLRLTPDNPENNQRAQSTILECSRQKATQEMARMLEIRSGDTLIYIKRTMNLGNRPSVIDEIWLPADVFKGLTSEILIHNKGPLYGLFETKFGVSMVRAEEKVRAVAASPQIADFLNVSEGFPLLQVDRVSYTYGDRPMEIRRGFYLTDQYHYRNSLN